MLMGLLVLLFPLNIEMKSRYYYDPFSKTKAYILFSFYIHIDKKVNLALNKCF